MSVEIKQTPLMGKLTTQLFGNIPATGVMKEAKAVAKGLPIFAQALVEGVGRKIQLRRSPQMGGRTDGRTVYIMDTPIPASDEKQDEFILFLALSLGLIHHEVGHVNESDFSIRLDELDTLVRQVLGIVEDVRMENAHIKRFPASRKYLDALSMASIVIGMNAEVPHDCPPIGAFTAWLLFYLRNTARKEPHFGGMAKQAKGVVETLFPAGMTDRMEPLLQEVPHLRNEREALALSKKIAKLLKKELKQEQEKEQQQEQEQDQGDSQDQDQGQGQGDSQGQGQDDGNSQGQGQGGGTNSQQPGVADNLQSLIKGENAESAKGDLGDDVRRVLQELGNEILNGGVESIINNEGIANVTLDWVGEPETHHLNPEMHDFDEAFMTVSKLRSVMKRKFLAKTETRTGRSRRGAKIDGRVLHRVAIGDGRIFRSQQSGRDLDTSVVLLLDTSGSMDVNNRITTACAATFAAACAMQGLPGVEVSVLTFPRELLVLPFGVRANKAKANFALVAGGCTPMTTALIQGQKLLKGRKSPRKMIITITDGEANDPASTEAMIVTAQRAGIEVYGLGIEVDSGRGLFPTWVYLRQVHELPEALLGLLQKSLVA